MAAVVVPLAADPFTVTEVGAEERSLAGDTLFPEADKVILALLEAPPPESTAAVAPLYVPAAIEEANRTHTVVPLVTVATELEKALEAEVVEISYPD